MMFAPRRGTLPVFFVVLLAVFAFPGVVSVAQDPPAGDAPPGRTPREADEAPAPAMEARMPVRVVAGRLIVRCEISTKFRRIPTNLLIDFDRLCGLELHNRAAAGIRLDDEGGVPITIHLPGSNITVERREHGDEEYLEELTRLYSKELGETACLGTIGANVFSNYHVIFDLSSGFVTLRSPAEVSGEPPAEEEGSLVTSVSIANDLVWVPVRLADDRVMSLSVGTSAYDSIIDAELAEDLDHPAGDIGPVRLKTLDLSQYVAWRPEELVQVHSDGALGTIGLNLLERFRVEIDRVNGFARFTETRPAEFPEADLAFFQARLEEEIEPLVAYLEKYPGSRLAREAAEVLLNLQLDEDSDAEEFALALEWMDKTRIEDLRATEALDTMDSLIESRRSDVAIMAGEIGVKSGRKDRYPESVHKLHSKLGELLLETENGTREAWKHLLSAAFGLPDDGIINLNLGRVYERERRYNRAVSRYIQAIIAPESGPQAVECLERVQREMAGEPLSVDLVDKLVSGKVHNFSAATKFEASESTDTNRTVLVELFTNAHFGRQLREGWRSFAIGGSMAIEGLLSHFPQERIAVLSYHVPTPEPTALQNALSLTTSERYGDSRPVYTMVNGRVKGPGAQTWRRAEGVYEANRQMVTEALSEPSKYTLTLSGKVEDGNVSGSVTAKGPADENVQLQVILAERGVLYPGKAKIVVHRMVARAPLTGYLEGLPYEPTDGSMKFDFSRTLADIKEANEKELAIYEQSSGGACTRLSTSIDPRQVTLVAFLRHKLSGEILQAIQIDPEGAEPEKDA